MLPTVDWLVNRLSYSILIGCLLLMAGCSGTSTSGQESASVKAAAKAGHRLYEAGVELINSQQTDSGAVQLSKAMDALILAGLNDSAYMAAYALIRIYLPAMRYDEGIGIFERVQGVPVADTSLYRAKMLIGVSGCYASLFQEETALRMLDTALQIHNARKASGVSVPVDEDILQNTLNNRGLVSFRIGTMYQMAGLVSLGEKQLQAAHAQLDSSLAIRKRLAIPAAARDSLVAELYSNKGLVYRAQKKYKLALEAHQQALSLQRSVNPRLTVKEANYQFNIADVLLDSGAYAPALALHDQVLQVYRDFGATEIDLMETYTRMTRVYIRQKDFDQAMAYIQRALKAYSVNFDPAEGDEWKNPDLSNVFIRVELLEVLQLKSAILWETVNQEDSDELRRLLPTFELAFQLISQLKARLYSENARYLIGVYSAKITDLYIRLIHKLGDPVEKSFRFADAGRGNILFQGISLNRIQGLTDVSESVRLLENRLDNQVNSLEPFAFIYNKMMPGSEPAVAYSDQLAEAQREKDSLVEVIRVSYPNYYALRYEAVQGDLAAVQKVLAGDQLLLEYFWGDSSLYTFKITSQKAELFVQPLDSLEAWITQYVQSVHIPESGENSAYDRRAFVHPLHQLYQQLLGNVLGPEEEKIKRITVIPDKRIALVPFAALLRSLPDSQSSPLDYAIRHHSFTYNYSVSILAYQQIQRESVSVPVGFLGMAPFAIEKERVEEMPVRDSLYWLPQSGDVIKALEARPRLVLLNEAATLSAFLTHAPQYGIWDLSTHATVNHDFPDSSMVAFYPLAEGEYRLMPEQIADLRGSPQLVVLSACETGLGQDVVGEGVLSLGRAFMLAGARSVLATLWRVRSGASNVLMADFYERMAAGDPKDIALQVAQVRFLDGTGPSALLEGHPYYWAGFTPVGDPLPVVLEGESSFLWGKIGAVSLTGFFLLVWLAVRRRSGRSV